MVILILYLIFSQTKDSAVPTFEELKTAEMLRLATTMK